jgi:predicted nucleic acid binding AN1-type Zn finger protein
MNGNHNGPTSQSQSRAKIELSKSRLSIIRRPAFISRFTFFSQTKAAGRSAEMPRQTFFDDKLYRNNSKK